jgi:hypothetical protein
MAAQIQEDLSPKLMQIIQADPRFLSDLKRGLITKVAAGDGMNAKHRPQSGTRSGEPECGATFYFRIQ